MIYRREKPKLRESILRICDLYGYSLHELLTQDTIHFNAGYKTQIRLMLDEEKRENLLKDVEYILFEDVKIPLMFCEERRSHGRRIWRFFCPYCLCFHHHAPCEGHRWSHCEYGSPFKEKGYYLSTSIEGVKLKRVGP